MNVEFERMFMSRPARWLLVALWCAGIFVLSHQSELPGPQTFALNALLKKAGHVMVFGGLMFVVLHALEASAHPASRTLLMAFALVSLYAISDEIHQRFVPGRSGQVFDVLVDLCGAIAGAALYRIWRGAGTGRNRYWLLFALSGWILLLFNLPWQNLPAQDPGVLFRDPLMFAGFNFFGLLIVPLAALMLEDASRRTTRAGWLALPLMAVGIMALAPFMALRPQQVSATPRALPAWLQRAIDRRWFWAFCALAFFANLLLLPGASWPAFVQAQLQFVGIGFMWLDIVVCMLCALPLLQADLALRGGHRAWLWAVALTGPLALALYLARRPDEVG